MRNLVSNAVKYSNNGGEVHITSVSYGNYLEIAVSDNGITGTRIVFTLPAITPLQQEWQ